MTHQGILIITYPNTFWFSSALYLKLLDFSKGVSMVNEPPIALQQLRWLVTIPTTWPISPKPFFVEVMPARSLTPQLKTFQAVEDLTDCSKKWKILVLGLYVGDIHSLVPSLRMAGGCWSMCSRGRVASCLTLSWNLGTRRIQSSGALVQKTTILE